MSSRQLSPATALTSLETIRNISEVLMREQHRLHSVIEYSCRQVNSLPSPKYGNHESPPELPELAQDVDSCSELPQDIAEHTRLKPQSQAVRIFNRDNSGLPDYVKQCSNLDAPWVFRQKTSEGKSEDNEEDAGVESSGTRRTSRSSNSSDQTQFKRNLAKDFAVAQGWLAHCNTVVYATQLQRWLETSRFDTFCTFCIIANSLLMGTATDYGASNAIADESNLPFFFRLADNMFSAWFMLELLLRCVSVGPVRFWSIHNPMWTWNYFDTVVVTLNAFDNILRMFQANGFGANAAALRTVRVLRVARALRVVRLFRFFRTLRMMVLSMLSSFTALFWAMVLLAVIMFTFAIFLTQNVTKYLYDDDLPISQKKDVSDLKLYFGRLIHTVYYLFLSISGGISWVEVSNPLFNIDASNGLIFCFFVFASVFAMLNIITGIFLDTAIRAAQSDKDESIAEQLDSEDSTIRALQHIFKEADTDNSGALTEIEFDRHLSNDRVRAHLASLGIEAGRASALFRLLDLDDSGAITVDEFLFGCMRLRGGAKGLDVATLLYENKRLLHKWIVFMTYVEKEFKSMKGVEARLEQKIQRLLALSSSQSRNSAFASVLRPDIDLELFETGANPISGAPAGMRSL